MLVTLWAVEQAGTLDGLPIRPDGIGTVGLVIVLFFMLARGSLATGREIREKNARIEYLQAALEEAMRQNGVLLHASVPATNAVMSALHQALENEEA